ncbi:DUF3179 domain-containing protein [Patescibacteria group bacterium]|nr:DUF3179 domain-containing protein [Patescibacteria group bacterium]
MRGRISEFLKKHRSSLVLFFVVILVVVGVAWFQVGGRLPTPKDVANVAKETAGNASKVASSLLGNEFNINEEKFIVDPSKLVGGGPPKDGIPSIDEPKFESAVKAEEWMRGNDRVFGIVHKGEARAYPQRILVWHEIVNEKIKGDPILITYCPLCQSSLAFERKVELSDGSKVETEFGISGKLYNSNLVMYNRTNDKVKTESLWTQFGGKAIIGDFTGQELEKVILDTVTWKNWKAKHPDTKVLSRDTGFARDYDNDPYGSYYTQEGVIAPLENTDDRLFEKALVFGIKIGDKTKAYPEDELKKTPKFTDTFAGKKIEITRNSDGSVRMKNLTDNKAIVPEIGFWFAWAAFNPDTELYRAP